MNLPVEVFEKQMPLRRFMVLVRGLPADSAYAYFTSDDENRDMMNPNIDI